jgi:hypothetical protein
VRDCTDSGRETTIFFQRIFQTFPTFPNILEKFGKVWEKLWKTFPNFLHSETLFYCHYKEYYISSTRRNRRDEVHGRNIHSSEQTTCHFPKKLSHFHLFQTFPNFYKLSQTFPKVKMCKYDAFYLEYSISERAYLVLLVLSSVLASLPSKALAAVVRFLCHHA